MDKLILNAIHGIGVSLMAFALIAGTSVTAWAANASASDETQPPILQSPADAGTRLAPPAGRALPGPTAGETLVYFFPSDNDATATVIHMLNTDSVAHTVPLRGYSAHGVLVFSMDIAAAATTSLYLISDSLAASPPPSWAGPSSGGSGVDPVTTNFTDFTFYASFSLPKGVKVSGYTIFNPGTGTIDPRADQGAIPLKFMSDPFYLP